MHQTDLIEQIKERREVLQLTQEALAELAGVGLRTLKEIESGKGNPTLETIQKLMDVLGLELVLKVRKMNTNK
jgi:y4mF family transcriptional regulator